MSLLSRLESKFGRYAVPNLTMAITVGSGHFIQLMAPEQVNPMIDRFLELVRTK